MATAPAPDEPPDARDPASVDGPAGAPARTLRVDRFQTISLPDAPPPPEPRPRRRGKVDVSLERAPFDDVARMLSDVGGFALVVEAPSAGTVDATLRGVDAWDALVAIAHAKGLVVTWERGIGIVRPP